MKNGFGAQTADTSDVFVLLSCCWLCRLTVGWICSVSRPSAPEQSFRWNCAQTEEATACPRRTDWNTHTNLGRPYIVCGPVFLLSFFNFFFSLSASLLCPPFFYLSLPLPAWEKWSVLKHVLNITIFTFSCFKKAAKGGSVWCVFFFFLVERSGSRVRLCLKL